MHSNISTHKITEIMPHSPADLAGIKVGESLLSINGQPLIDIFDYYYFSEDSRLSLLIEGSDGTRTVLIEKDEDEDLGLGFESALLDDYRRCNNACIFCFIDQMPPGMRETLYFKDDDTRLSFLQGNYVTLTNLSDADLSRIIDYRLAPINISVHATNPDIRIKMLNNRFAGDIMDKMRRIAAAKLSMNAQIVLCKGINDGEILEQSIRDLASLHPFVESVSVVPVGLTKYRKGLYELQPFQKEDALLVLEQLHRLSDQFRHQLGVGFVYGADEWYLLAKEELPSDEAYDGYPQLENGVGMVRLLMEEFSAALEEEKPSLFMKKREISIASGILAAPIIEKLCDDLTSKFSKITVHVYPITNYFFGEGVTVSGLITGTDLMEQLKGVELGSSLLIPINMLRSEEDVFLDDVRIRDVEEALQVEVRVVEADGADLVQKILHRR